MESPRATVRAIGGAVIATALLFAVLGLSADARDGGCGRTTLDATILRGPGGTLRCGPGEATVVRDDLAQPLPSRSSTRTALSAFVAMAQVGIVDEESPFRAEFMDACGSFPDRVFRPHETLIPALANAQVAAINNLTSRDRSSPVIGTSYDFALGLGSATDARQLNEVLWFIQLLDGGGLLDPDSGADGYEGAQKSDPRGASTLKSPEAGMSLRDLGNEPFVARGLQLGPAPLPWLNIVGERDIRPFGMVPANASTNGMQEAWATGSIKPGNVGPQQQREACNDPSALGDPAYWQGVAAQPGSTGIVSPDDDRRPVTRDAWIGAHRVSGGAPAGHGFSRSPCTTANGTALARGCWSWDQAPLKFIALDTTPDEGSGASIDAAQLAWLERELRKASSSYFLPNGTEKRTSNADRIIVIAQHHGSSSLDGDGGASAADLQALLLRYPNVVLQLTGHERRHRIVAHQDPSVGSGYYEVATAPVSDWPSQSRSIEIADNHDGTLSIFSVLVDAAADPDPRAISWKGDDPTNERALGASRNVNEAWLASAAREIAANDPGRISDAAGTARDRNVELVIANPLGVTGQGGVPIFPPTAGGAPAPPGFPTLGGIPSTGQNGFSGFGENPFDFTPAFQPPPLTRPGLAVFPTSAGGWGGRGLRLLLPAGLVAYWLARARVRRWMVGI